ncbi:MAG: alpha/beta fold hydrolase [Alphaproteobacteria bacterium]
MTAQTMPQDIDTRFQMPTGWRWHNFERNGRKIRFGSVFPQDSIPDAVVVCVQGVREFSEKYFEVARWCNDQNLAFWTMDWVGQGKSTRYLDDPEKRHSDAFEEDIEDLHYFIMEYIKHSSVHPDKGRIPLALLAHSMGANIGLRFLHKYPEVFECAAFSAPMIALKVFEKIPQRLALCATTVCNSLLSSNYVPGGNNWEARTEHARLSFDEERNKIHDLWCEHDPELRCGDVTYGWLHEAQKSCLELQKTAIHSKIITPCLFGIPAHEDLVDNKIIQKVIGGTPYAQCVEYPGSAHEILMEKDDIRTNYLENFYKLIEETIIDRPETLKPF